MTDEKVTSTIIPALPGYFTLDLLSGEDQEVFKQEIIAWQITSYVTLHTNNYGSNLKCWTSVMPVTVEGSGAHLGSKTHILTPSGQVTDESGVTSDSVEAWISGEARREEATLRRPPSDARATGQKSTALPPS